MIFGGKNLYCDRRIVALFPAFDRTGARKPLRRGRFLLCESLPRR
jgi:hypothetical protein